MCKTKFLRKIPIFTLIFIYCAITTTVYGLEDDYCTITTNSGRIRGIQNRTLLEKIPYFSFRGIPFAEPPIGDLRFKVSNNYIQPNFNSNLE